MKSLLLVAFLALIASVGAFAGECGCKVNVVEVHLVTGDVCPGNEVMTGHPSHEEADHHQVLCGKLVCECGSCKPE